MSKHVIHDVGIVIYQNVSQFIKSPKDLISPRPERNDNYLDSCIGPHAVCRATITATRDWFGGSKGEPFAKICVKLEFFTWLSEFQGVLWQTLLQRQLGDSMPLQALQHTTWLGAKEDRSIFESFGLLL
jgi:hypothetical protein